MRLSIVFCVFLLVAFLGFSEPKTSPARTNVNLKTFPPDLQSLELPPGAALLTELVMPLDARQCKQGDLVEARVVKDLKHGKQVVVKAGTELRGRVISIQQPSTPGGETVLDIVFDRAQTKSGQQFATQLTLQALAPPVDFEGNSDSLSSGRGLADNHIKAANGDQKDSTVTGSVGQLNESSRGVYHLRDIKLATEMAPAGATSIITWTAGNPVLKKHTQLLFAAQAQ
jgi:hypothetical protein